MAIGRRTGGAPRWLGILAGALAAALLLVLTVVYLGAVHVRTALTQFSRDAARNAAASRPVRGIPFADLINRTAGAHSLNPALVAAVVFAESGFDPRARSPRGARGLMQVMPATWREVGGGTACAPEVARLTAPPCMDDPETNLTVGAAYLRRLIDRFHGDPVRAVAAYNAGTTPVLRARGVPPFPETSRYLRQVAVAWFHLQRDGTLTPLWQLVLRSVRSWPGARAAAVPAVIALLPWIWPVPRRGTAGAPAVGVPG